ncbi:hypothetical protein LXL04_029815 [Taraxacum kok-saghyz]
MADSNPGVKFNHISFERLPNPFSVGMLSNHGSSTIGLPNESSEVVVGSTRDQLIGSKLRTRWPDDNNFYEAVIVEYNPVQGLHALLYNKNTPQESFEWVNLKENPVDMEGLKNAHIRDGAAVVQYLAWLDMQMQELYGASGYFKESESQKTKTPLGDAKLTEVSVSDKLEEFHAAKKGNAV